MTYQGTDQVLSDLNLKHRSSELIPVFAISGFPGTPILWSSVFEVASTCIQARHCDPSVRQTSFVVSRRQSTDVVSIVSQSLTSLIKMSVFAFLKAKVESHAGKRAPDELVPGMRYPVYMFVQRQSDYIDKKTQQYPMTLVAYVQDPTLPSKYYVTMPALYNNLDEDRVKELNSAIQPGKHPVIVYYGKDGKRNDVLIHTHDEENDDVRLAGFSKNDCSKKRKHEDDPSTSQE